MRLQIAIFDGWFIVFYREGMISNLELWWMNRKHRLVVICVILSLFLPVYSRNSDTFQEKQEDVQEEVTVTLKLVQVYVTDKKGNAITDLKQEDFELKDNGKRQRITDFEQHTIPLPSTAVEAQPEKPQDQQP